MVFSELGELNHEIDVLNNLSEEYFPIIDFHQLSEKQKLSANELEENHWISYFNNLTSKCRQLRRERQEPRSEVYSLPFEHKAFEVIMRSPSLIRDQQDIKNLSAQKRRLNNGQSKNSERLAFFR